MSKKEHTIEATGRYFITLRPEEYSTEVGKEQATEAIQDMLRYDHGRVLYLDIVKENRSFTAIVRSSNYTKGRWNSFGIRTREVNYDSYFNGVSE